MDREIRRVRGVRLVLLTAGGNFLGRVNQGGGYVRIAPHEERTVTLRAGSGRASGAATRAPPSAATTPSAR